MKRAVATDAEREASRWLVRLESPDVSLDDHRRFRAWLGASEENRDAYAAISGTWDKLDALEGLAPAPPAKSSRRKLLLMGGGAAAALAAVAAVTVIAPWNEAQAYETGIGERRTITLDDASTIELNADSRVLVRYSDNARQVSLERGEALFDVTRNPSRPFTVQTTLGAVTVRGTSFVVRLSEGEMRTTVLRGVVESVAANNSAASAPIVLEANQELQVANGAANKVELSSQAVGRRLAWRDGMLAFDGETLREAVADVERQTGVHFTFADPSIGDLRIGGYVSATDVDAFTGLLEDNVGLHTRRISDERILLAK